MKFAIDRIRIGFEEEVRADEFYGSYIPKKKHVFSAQNAENQFFGALEEEPNRINSAIIQKWHRHQNAISV